MAISDQTVKPIRLTQECLGNRGRLRPACPSRSRRPSVSARASDGAGPHGGARMVCNNMMRTEFLRFNGAVERDPAIDLWMKEHAGELGAAARQWFEVMRNCGD